MADGKKIRDLLHDSRLYIDLNQGIFAVCIGPSAGHCYHDGTTNKINECPSCHGEDKRPSLRPATSAPSPDDKGQPFAGTIRLGHQDYCHNSTSSGPLKFVLDPTELARNMKAAYCTPRLPPRHRGVVGLGRVVAAHSSRRAHTA